MAEGCPPAASGIPGVAVPPVSSAVTRVSPQGRDACHRAGSRPVRPEGALLPGARAAPGRPAGCWCPVEENTPVTMLGGAGAARCHPGATLVPSWCHPVPPGARRPRCCHGNGCAPRHRRAPPAAAGRYGTAAGQPNGLTHWLSRCRKRPLTDLLTNQRPPSTWRRRKKC